MIFLLQCYIRIQHAHGLNFHPIDRRINTQYSGILRFTATDGQKDEYDKAPVSGVGDSADSKGKWRKKGPVSRDNDTDVQGDCL